MLCYSAKLINLCVCIRLCVYAYGVYKQMWKHLCRGLRSVWGIFLNCSPHFFFKIESLSELRTHQFL